MARKLGEIQLEREKVALQREKIELQRAKYQEEVWARIHRNMQNTGRVPDVFVLPNDPPVNIAASNVGTSPIHK